MTVTDTPPAAPDMGGHDVLAWLARRRAADLAAGRPPLSVIQARDVRSALRSYRSLARPDIEAVLARLESAGWLARAESAARVDAAGRWLVRPDVLPPPADHVTHPEADPQEDPMTDTTYTIELPEKTVRDGARDGSWEAVRDWLTIEWPYFRCDLTNAVSDALDRVVDHLQGHVDYPVAVGDVVGLGLAPDPSGNITCPVGQVTAVGPTGVTLTRFQWGTGTFAGAVFVRWDRVMEIRSAGLDDGDDPDLSPVVPLSDFQARWTRSAESTADDPQRLATGPAAPGR